MLWWVCVHAKREAKRDDDEAILDPCSLIVTWMCQNEKGKEAGEGQAMDIKGSASIVRYLQS